MNNSKNQDFLKEIVDIFQENYTSPIKVIVWAKVFQEWGRFIVGGTIIILMIGYILFSRSPRSDISSLPKDQQNILSNLRQIVTVMDLSKKSVNERQDLYADLMHTVDMYAHGISDQENLGRQIRTLTSTAEICHSKRGRYISYLSKAKNPLSAPDIATSYANMLNSQNGLPEHKEFLITVESEQQQWNLLCKLCETELQKAQQELAQLLSTRAR